MLSRPAILIDVDGPLNPYLAKPTRRPAGYTTHRIRPAGFARPLRVWLDPSHGPWLLSLAAATGADLVWATTWEHEANEFIGPRLGLPELEWIDFGGQGSDHRDGHHGKVPAITECAGSRPIAWLDDEFQRRDPQWAAARPGTLLVPVDARKGIGIDHLEQVQAFFTDISVATPLNLPLQ
ncbi:HAD domain-containing protein [Lentzea terrae]|uniref:HAD domain-containing protein n=1 Tax=Lentzea terrae TaxID=2200761 RepID=UPI000DD43CE7|nr:HAD domain-containing protein [Lentzea terrae]